MASYLEISSPAGSELVPLGGSRIAIGKSPGNDVVLSGDVAVSRLHAVLERYPTGWTVRDLSSRNGTFVNGERVAGERPFHAGDELRIGSTRMLLRTRGQIDQPSETEPSEPPPPITPRERDVLVELCRPVLDGAVFMGPATVKQVAHALVVTEGAVRQHLMNLAAKFGIEAEGEERRSLLANEAIRRGAVSAVDLTGR